MTVRFPDKSEWQTTAMRLVDGVHSRGAWFLGGKNKTEVEREQAAAIHRRAAELAPRVDAGDLTFRAAVDEIVARPYGRVH